MKYFLIVIVMIAMSCSSTNKIAREKKTIPYVLQANVTELLENEIIKYKTKFFFILNHLSADTFRIELIKNENNRNLFASLTNRKLLLSKELFPVVLDFDDNFAVSETGSEILKKNAKDPYFSYTKQFHLYHAYYYVTFIRNGEIIEKGYEGSKTKN